MIIILIVNNIRYLINLNISNLFFYLWLGHTQQYSGLVMVVPVMLVIELELQVKFLNSTPQMFLYCCFDLLLGILPSDM